MSRFTEADLDTLAEAIDEHGENLPSSYATHRRCYECESTYELDETPENGSRPDDCECGDGCEYVCIVPLSDQSVADGTPLEDFAEGGGIRCVEHRLVIHCED